MKIIFPFLVLAFLFTSCNDGDVITTELDFGNTFDTTNCSSELICHKIKTDPDESLSILLNTTLVNLISTQIDVTNPLLVNLINPTTTFTSRPFNYRTYSNTISNTIFCSAIPPSNLGVTNDYSSSVDAIIEVILTEDDNDGIPAEFEDINNDGNLENDDTDGDGLPNYMDADDDGDNVLTSVEMANFTTDFELTMALDTDGDLIPNYLDTDDDNDGVLTINEEGFTTNQDPADDITDNTVGADYLNPSVTNNVTSTAFRPHTITQSFQISLELSNIALDILNQDFLDFGTLTTTDSRTVTPI